MLARNKTKNLTFFFKQKYLLVVIENKIYEKNVSEVKEYYWWKLQNKTKFELFENSKSEIKVCIL